MSAAAAAAELTGGGRRPPFVLAGPTGVGKTAVSLELAASLDAEIVCADSRQLYRGLDVATGKPTAAERGRVPHHGYDRLDPRETSSAGDYARVTGPQLEEIAARGRVALLVGGTGLYLRAAHAGLAEVPPVAPEVRAEVRARLEREGPEALHRSLAALDPALAARLSPRDRQRVARGLEVALGTSRPLSAWQEEAQLTPEPWFWVALLRPRAELTAAITARAHGFFAHSLVDEVRALLAAGVPREAPAFDALGYREAIQVLDGTLAPMDAADALVRHTVHYAKRQVTWLRGEARRVPLVFREVGSHESPGQVAQELAGLYEAWQGTLAPAAGGRARATAGDVAPPEPGRRSG
jgi:tRNA dimethylallyltransferase